MNSTHLAAGLGGFVGGDQLFAALTTVLTGYHGLDADHAKALAYLILAAGVTVFSLATWFIRWKYPNVPVGDTSHA